MKYLNTYENWFTNIFKTGDDMWQDHMDYVIGKKITPKWNPLFGAASEGNWKRFKNLLPNYINHINDVIAINGVLSIDIENLLILIVKNNKIGNWEKKKMITALIDNNVDISFRTSEGKDFYDLMDTKIKTWFKQKYPEIVENLELYKNSNKYNL